MRANAGSQYICYSQNAGDKNVGGLNRLKALAISRDRLASYSLTRDAKAGMEEGA
jgi:hypothetical protein